MPRPLAPLLVLAALAGAPAVHAADVISDRAEATAVVIYRNSIANRPVTQVGDGVAMIVETRTLDLPAGQSTVRFRRVADTLIPQTASVVGLPGGLIEQNFDYDLLTPGALLAASVGDEVKLMRTLPGSGRVTETRGVIRSAPQGVLLEADGKVEALSCSGLPERLVFDRAPANLADSPTLSLQTTAEKAGRYKVTLRYLAGSFNWAANYVATIRPDGRTLDIQGWLSLANQSGSSFAEAPTQVVAGKLSRSPDTRPTQVRLFGAPADCWPATEWADMVWRSALPPPPPPPAPPAISLQMAAPAALQEIVVTATRRSAEAEQTELGDYKLYTLAYPTTVAARQVKQVAFLTREAVPFERVYTFQSNGFEPDEEVGAQLMLRMQNTEAGRLGAPLPSGSVALLQPTPAGPPMLIGERRLEDTSVGLPVELDLGETELPMTYEVTGTKHPSRPSGWRYAEKRIAVTNPKAHPVVVEVRQDMSALGARLLKEDHPHTNRDTSLVWRLSLQPNSSETLRYIIEAEE